MILFGEARFVDVINTKIVMEADTNNTRWKQIVVKCVRAKNVGWRIRLPNCTPGIATPS